MSVPMESTTNTKLTKANLVTMMPKEKAKHYFVRAKQLFIEGGQYAIVTERVIKDVTRAMSLDPKNPNHYMFLGKVYRCSLDIASAIYCYRFVVLIDPTNFMAREKLAECLQLRGQELMCEALKYAHAKGGYEEVLYKRAKYCIEDASRIKLEDQRLKMFSIICLIRLNKLDSALEQVNRIVKHGKKAEPELYILKAKLMWAAGFIGEGNKDIRYAAASYPDHPEVLAYTERVFSKAEKLYSMSLEAFALQRYEDAKRLVTYAVSISKEDVKLHILLAKILRVMGDMKGAYSSIQKAMAMYTATVSLGFDVPEEIVRQTNLIFNDMAIKYATEGDYEKSIALLTKIIVSEKALSRGLTDIDHKYYLNRGDCYRMQKQMALALADYIAALECCPGDFEIKTRISLAYYYSGTDYFNSSFYQEACIELTEAINYNPRVAEYYAARGQARYYCADYPGAYVDFKKALELDPNHVEVKNRIQQFESSGSNLSIDPNHPDRVMRDDDPLCHNLISTHHVTRQDTIDYLLNPRGKATRLPKHTVEKLKKERDSSRQEHEHTVEAAKKLMELEKEFHHSTKSAGGFLGLRAHIESEENSLDSEYADKSRGRESQKREIDVSTKDEFMRNNSHRLPAIHIHKKRNHLVTQSVLNDKVDTNKGQLWSIMDRAQDISKHLRGKADDAPKSPVGKLPKSSAGLKQHSQKLSVEAKKNPLISGHQTVIEEESESGKAVKRLQDVKKYVSSKRFGGDSIRTVDSTNSDDDPVIRDDRKRSIYYNMKEGPKLSIVREGGKMVLLSEEAAPMVIHSSDDLPEAMKHMKGESMMKMFKEQLLKRTFESLNQITQSVGPNPNENLQEAVSFLMDEHLSTLTEHSTDEAGMSRKASQRGTTNAITSSRFPTTARSYKLQTPPVLGLTFQQKREAAVAEAGAIADAEARQAVTWRVMEQQESSKGTSLLLLPEVDEVRLMNQFREREELKLKAKDEVMKALSFVTVKSNKMSNRHLVDNANTTEDYPDESEFDVHASAKDRIHIDNSGRFLLNSAVAETPTPIIPHPDEGTAGGRRGHFAMKLGPVP